MSKLLRFALSCGILCLFAAPALADEITLTIENPLLFEDIPVNFEAEFTDMQMITMTARGYGGGEYAFCPDEGGGYDLERNYHVLIVLDDVEFEFWAPMVQDYEVPYVIYYPGEMLADGSATLHISYDISHDYGGTACYPTDVYDFTMTEVVITVVSNSVVPTDEMSWAALKALYR